MQNRIIVHIGMPKTGTSSIQNFLFDNAEKLRQYGYCYPDFLKEMNEAGYVMAARPVERSKNGLAAIILREWEVQTDCKNKFAEAWNSLETKIVSYLKRYHVIISCEEIWIRKNCFELLSWLKHITPNICVVVYLRRQDLAMEAMWNQDIKRYRYLGKTLAQCLEGPEKEWMEERVLGYLEKLTKVQDIVSMDNMIVRIYESQQMYQMSGDVIDDFLYTLGIPISDGEWIKRNPSNERLNGSLLNIKKTMNECLAGREWFSGIIEEYVLKAASELNFPNEKEAYFSLEERKRFIESYAEENSEIAKKFLKRSDGRLFYDEVKDLSLHTDTILLEDIIKLFTYIALEQEKKIYEKTKFCIPDFLLKGRKLTLFGAGYQCKKFLAQNNLSVDLIVDNNRSKSGTEIYGCKVKHFDEVTDWSQRFVVITCVACLEMIEQLRALGMQYNLDFVVFEDNV